MLFHMSKREEYCTQHGEHQRLNETHKNLEEHHEDTHRNTDKRHRDASKGIDAPHDENDAGKRKGNGVSGHHVCK